MVLIMQLRSKPWATALLMCSGLAIVLCTASMGQAQEANPTAEITADPTEPLEKPSEKATSGDVASDAEQGTAASTANQRVVSRAAILVGSLTVFLLAVFVGFEVITKVPASR